MLAGSGDPEAARLSKLAEQELPGAAALLLCSGCQIAGQAAMGDQATRLLQLLTWHDTLCLDKRVRGECDDGNV